MKFISPELGQSLFERVYEVSALNNLGSKERLPKYRVILEDLFKELTKDENQFFSNLFARSEYIFKNYGTPAPIRKNADSLRLLANKIVHNSAFEPSVNDEPFSIRNLCTVLSHFSNVSIPEKLKAIYEPFLRNYFETVKTRPKPPVRESYAFYALVTSVLPAHEFAKNRILVCENEEFGTFKLLLWNKLDDTGFGSDLTPFADMVWPFATLYVTEVYRHAERDDEYNTSAKSLVVLEPDYLIEVKNLSECVQSNGSNPYINLLGRFSKGEINPSQITGNLVGAVLDDCSREDDYNYRRTFERYMRANAFGMLVIANENGAYSRANIVNIFNNALEHESNIKKLQLDRKSKKAYIEPTFISAEYGLLGRLDALYEDPADANRKDVLELKSGSPPSQGMWKNHEAQTIGYDLLLSSVFPARHGISAILYSKASGKEQALRFVSGDRFLERQKLLMLRNQIVANEIKLSLGHKAPIQAISLNGALPIPKYSEAHVEEFSRIYGALNPLDRTYFEEYIRFVFKELRIAKMGSEEIKDSNRGFASLWKRSKSEKISDYDALVYLTIDKITENSIIELPFPDHTLFPSGISGLRKGDSVVLYPTPDPEELNPLRSQILKGTLSEILTDRIIVNLISKQVDVQYFSTCKFWAVERDFRESSYRDMLLSLYQFVKSSPEYKGLIFGKTVPKFDDLPFVTNPALNANQNEIIQKALNAKDYYLIQGPPGTGKTSTVLRDIINRLNQRGEQIMVLAFTNRAVDEICKMLVKIEGLDFIRIGRGGLEPYTFQKLSDELNLADLHSRLIAAKVIVSTQSSFASNLDILQVKTFDTLVVDEASQLLEPQLVGYLSHFKRFILIGDENQLPAVVLQDQISSRTEKSELHEIYLTDLRESLFNRLLTNAQQKKWECYGMLTHHFRMHEEVADFINRAFYGSQLVAGLERQKEGIKQFDPNSENLIEQTLATNRVVFIPSKKEIHSKINDFESDIATQVVNLIRQKRKADFNLENSVGIIAPFRAQMANIKRLLPKELHQLSVDTIERYQGSERDVIVLSFAVRNAAQLKSVESLSQNDVDRKLNVALSRAREAIIITGCEEVLRKSKHIAALLDDIRAKGGYLEMPQQVVEGRGTVVDTSDLF